MSGSRGAGKMYWHCLAMLRVGGEDCKKYKKHAGRPVITREEGGAVRSSYGQNFESFYHSPPLPPQDFFFKLRPW